MPTTQIVTKLPEAGDAFVYLKPVSSEIVILSWALHCVCTRA
jgi:hypothetical protein